MNGGKFVMLAADWCHELSLILFFSSTKGTNKILLQHVGKLNINIINIYFLQFELFSYRMKYILKTIELVNNLDAHVD